MSSGASLKACCRLLGISPNTVRSWRGSLGAEDGRTSGEKSNPPNKLTEEEKERIRDVMNSPEYADMSPHKIVVRLADKGIYLCSESTMYRILREDGGVKRRTQNRKEDQVRIKPNLVATGPGQVFNWDITFIPSAIKGFFWKVLIILDMYSRRVMGFHAMEQDTLEQCTDFLVALLKEQEITTLKAMHGDNGSTLKGHTISSKLRSLGVFQSHSRPRVSNDNPYVESFLGTVKTSHKYPKDGFHTMEELNLWLESFIAWYNDEPHSSLNYVSPNQRHLGVEEDVLLKRLSVFNEARLRRPDRFPNGVRKIRILKAVSLLPMEDKEIFEYLWEKKLFPAGSSNDFVIEKELVLSSA